MSFKRNSNVKSGTVPVCFSLPSDLHSAIQRNGALLGPCHSCGAQPHGHADVERSLAASPSCAPDLVGVQVGSPLRCLHISQQCCARLLLGAGGAWSAEEEAQSCRPAQSNTHGPCCPTPVLRSRSSGEAAAHWGVSGSEAFFGEQLLQK